MQPLLSPVQEQVLALIAAGSPIAVAARSAGIHRNTVYNWLSAEAHFRQAHARAREAKALFWRDQTETLIPDAIEAIHQILRGDSAPASVRLKAAQSVLALAMTPPSDQPLAIEVAPVPIEPAQAPAALAEAPSAPSEAPAEPVESASHCAHLGAAHDIPAPPAADPASQPLRATPAPGRNDLCPCGSGKKFKRCCLGHPTPPSPALASSPAA